MSKTIRTLSGPKARKYLTELLAAGPGVPPEAVDHLAGRIEKEVVVVKVRQVKAGQAKKGRDETPLLPFAPHDIAETAPVASADEADSDTGDAADAEASLLESAERVEPQAPAFDPYAFSLVVAFTREGRDGLGKRLAAIDSADHLKALAQAQHVSLPSGANSLTDIRAAILAGTERRIADRKAAAS